MPPQSNSERKLFELRYRKGGLVQKAFFKEESLEKAVSIGRKYCESNGLFFVHVDPWECDLQELLNKKEELAKES
jgi:hypothetical protein